MTHKEHAEKVWERLNQNLTTRDEEIAIIAAALAAEYCQGAEYARDVAVEVLAFVSGDTIESAIGDVEEAIAHLLEERK